MQIFNFHMIIDTRYDKSIMIMNSSSHFLILMTVHTNNNLYDDSIFMMTVFASVNFTFVLYPGSPYQ